MPSLAQPRFRFPIPIPECSSDTESIDGKFSAAAQTAWEATAGPHEVVVAVRRDTMLCPRPACPGRAIECPELERYNEHNAQVAGASQTCVRNLIASLGGSASDEVFTLGNGLLATLTWPQIQSVAAHPDVVSMVPRFGDNPPP